MDKLGGRSTGLSSQKDRPVGHRRVAWRDGACPGREFLRRAVNSKKVDEVAEVSLEVPFICRMNTGSVHI